MEIILRLEEEKDHKIVENLTREAFWNVYFPGASEHLLAHNLRKTEEFVKELDFVAMLDDKIVGDIMYARANVAGNEVLTFGPVSVLPEYQNSGIGRKLINHTIGLAKELGYRAVIIYGDPEYYSRFGFLASKEYKITDKEGKYPAALLALELSPNALKGIEGVFDEGKAYEISESDVQKFEKNFPPKEKGYSKTQDRFIELVSKYI